MTDSTPQNPQQAPENAPTSSRKPVAMLIGALLFVLIAGGVFYLVVIRGNGNLMEGIKNALPFGEEAPERVIEKGDTSDILLSDLDLTGATSPSRMFKISDGPVAGAASKLLPGGNQIVRYVLREDADVHDFDLETRTSRLLVNNTIPKIYEAIWDKNAQKTLLRTINNYGEIATILGTIVAQEEMNATNTTPGSMREEFLPPNILFAAQGAVDGFVYTLLQGANLTVNTLDEQGVTTIFSSPFTEWLPEWPSPNSVTLATKPSAGVEGYLVTVYPDSKVVDQTLSAIPGLTARMSPDGKKILVGKNAARGNMQMSIIDRATKEEVTVSPATLPEKCTWSLSSTIAYCAVPQNPSLRNYPDEWYQGVVEFSDIIWKFDFETRLYIPVAAPIQAAGISMDVTSLSLTSDERYLFFINKKDGSLWGVDLLSPVPEAPASPES